jgi:hypothetical protein
VVIRCGVSILFWRDDHFKHALAQLGELLFDAGCSLFDPSWGSHDVRFHGCQYGHQPPYVYCGIGPREKEEEEIMHSVQHGFQRFKRLRYGWESIFSFDCRCACDHEAAAKAFLVFDHASLLIDAFVVSL